MGRVVAHAFTPCATAVAGGALPSLADGAPRRRHAGRRAVPGNYRYNSGIVATSDTCTDAPPCTGAIAAGRKVIDMRDRISGGRSED